MSPEPSHDVREVSTGGATVRIEQMRTGDIAQIVESIPSGKLPPGKNDGTIIGAYIMRHIGGVVFLSLPSRGWTAGTLPLLEHRVRVLPTGAKLTLTVGEA
jgi:hypothetical protein